MDYSTKFNPGDEVWTMCQNKLHKFRVACVEIILTPPNSPMRSKEMLVEHINTAPRNNPQRLIFDARACFATKQELLTHLSNSDNG